MTIAYAICATTDISNRQGKAFSLLREGEDGTLTPWRIFVVRWGKQVYGYVNRCPHQGVNLDFESNRFIEPFSKTIVCGKHGSQFELETGRCIEGPCLGQSLEPVDVVIIDGDICVTGVTLAED